MKALVIDDSRVMRRIVSSILVDLGFVTVEAGDGREALEQLEAHPDVTLCCIDWNMPVMTGLEFVVETRKHDQLRDVTLMMVTTEGEYDQIVRALAAGAHEYVIKPFTRDVIVDKLQLLGLMPTGVSR
ncbi:response regulator [Demequina sp.]|uniref:response regulator n=1 Tax=Demequina sp. TaxID=2050685 RepID=UPI003A877CD0